MFRNQIMSTLTTLTSETANKIFDNIQGCLIENDDSSTVVSRALLGHRISKGTSFQIYNYRFYGMPLINDNTDVDSILRFLPLTPLKNALYIIDSELRTKTDRDKIFNVLERSDLFNRNFKVLDDVSVFFSKYGFKVRVFINEEMHSSLVFTEQISMPKFHLLLSLFPRYVPWYFDETPLNEAEIELLRTLTTKDVNAFVEQVECIAETFDFRSEFLEQQLKDFGHVLEKQQLELVQSDIVRQRNRMSDCIKSYGDCYAYLQDLLIKEAGIMTKLREEDSNEILDFFLSNKNIELSSATNNGVLDFVVKTYISNYNIDLFDKLIENKTSAFYQKYGTTTRWAHKDITDERICRLMKAIFREERLKLMVCAAYSIDLTRGSVVGLSHFNYDAKFKDYIPNQHIDVYACLGNNAPKILDAIKSKKYNLAIQLCMASAANMNMTESNTISFFMEKIFGNPVECIEMPDGSRKTPLEAMLWLEEEDKEQEATENE